MDFVALAQQCAPGVHHTTMSALATVESGHNPFAIGVVGGRLVRAPATKEEAIATARSLEAQGFNFSVGIVQVNRFNLPRYGLTYETAFEPCANVRVGGEILTECYQRATARFKGEQQALQAAMSCYYSGNFVTGFKRDFVGQPSYVQKVLDAAGAGRVSVPVVRSQAKEQQSGDQRREASGRDDTSPDSVMVFR
jgi:type IV secretion system protein VirB1